MSEQYSADGYGFLNTNYLAHRPKTLDLESSHREPRHLIGDSFFDQ
jgi:hypothetical protein